MEFRVETGTGMEEAFLAFVIVDINWKNKYIGSETIRWQIPIGGNPAGTLRTNYFPKMLFFPKIVYL
jgi:hypothetical protein